MEQVVVFAIPVFLILMVIEFAYGCKRKTNTYQLADTLSNLMLGLISRVFGYVLQFFHIGIYILVYRALWAEHPVGFWKTGVGMILAIVVFDFFDYWLHRIEHESGIFWAAHVVHHQSEQFNFSVALRQVTTEPILGFILYLPLALMGIPPDVFAIAALVVLFYQYWVHTQHIGKLGWFDQIFDSPSNHRVHHAINPQYIDKNFGSIFIIWDRLFGTYEPEVQTPIYGTVKPFRNLNPIWASCIEYVQLFKKIKNATTWGHRCRAVFAAPGWQPSTDQTPLKHASAEVMASFQQRLQEGPIEPYPLTRAMSWLVVIHFLVYAVAAIATMSVQDQLAISDASLCIAALLSGFGALSQWMQNQMKWHHLLAIDLVCLTLLYHQLV